MKEKLSYKEYLVAAKSAAGHVYDLLVSANSGLEPLMCAVLTDPKKRQKDPLYKHIKAALALGESPVVPHYSIDETLDMESSRDLIDARSREDAVAVIRKLPIGSEPWRSGVRRLKNLIIGIDGFA